MSAPGAPVRRATPLGVLNNAGFVQPTVISPSSDQSSWSMTWLIMRGVSTRYWGSAAIAALK